MTDTAVGPWRGQLRREQPRIARVVAVAVGTEANRAGILGQQRRFEPVGEESPAMSRIAGHVPVRGQHRVGLGELQLEVAVRDRQAEELLRAVPGCTEGRGDADGEGAQAVADVDRHDRADVQGRRDLDPSGSAHPPTETMPLDSGTPDESPGSAGELFRTSRQVAG